ncbi:MAG: hypothetical protein M3Z96_11975 [Pseudomonadota bacterium]|nr:hypothetical protein [Pseudomonadota bacterium]
MRPIHAKAMPVLLNTWLMGSADEATALQKPLSNDALRIVAMGEKSDRASTAEYL